MRDNLPTTNLRPVPQMLPSEFTAPLGHGVGENSENQLREYWRTIYKHRLVIIAVIGLTSLIALVYSFTATPLYTAQSRIRISTYEPVLTATKIEDMLQQKSRETAYLETQIEEIRSFSLADKVLQDEIIKKAFQTRQQPGFFSKLFGTSSSREEEEIDPFIGGPESVGYKSRISEIKDYLNSVSVQPIRRTSLVVIQAISPNAGLSSRIANKHALEYIDWVRTTRVEQQSSGLKFLTSQAAELREKVADLEREAADYAEANSIVAVNKDENITVQKMSQLNELLTTVTGKKIEAENLYKEAEAALANPNAGYDDSSTQTMRAELAKLESEHEELGAKFTDSYPKMQQLKAQIQGLKESIERQRKQIVVGLKAKAQAAAEEEQNLIQELEQQKSQAFELSKKQVQYNILNRELTSSRELLQNVLKQIKETSLAVESNASNVSVVDYAAVPKSPSYPRKKFLLLVGAFLGAVLGVLGAFLLEYLDNTIRTPEDLSHLTHIPTLGVVPSFELDDFKTDPDGKRRAVQNRRSDTSQIDELGLVPSSEQSESAAPPIVFINDPKSLASEAYRTIRTGILLSQAGEPPRVILVSSAQSSEGKTTSSVNVAVSLASAGGRVVIIDADLRRPSIYKHFRLDKEGNGLVEVLTGQMSLDDVITPDVAPRVSAITSGKIPPNPAELLGSLEMAQIIDQLQSRFDYVVIDSPPVLPVTDSVILSRYVDGVVLVVRGASTPKKVVHDAKNRLASVGARFLGAILNDVDVTGGDYYYYNRYYYSYYHGEKDSPSGAKKAASA